MQLTEERSSDAPDHWHRTPGLTSRHGMKFVGWAALGVGAVSVVAARVHAALVVVAPTINADEAGHLVNARSITTAAVPGTSHYFPGYSLLVSPAFWLEPSDPAAGYRLVLLLNVLLALIGAVLAVVLMRRIDPEAPRWRALLVAVVGLSLPSWIGYSMVAMSENAMVPALLGVLLLLVAPLSLRSPVSLFSIAAIAAFVSSINPRAGLFGVAIVLVCGVVLGRRRSWLSLGAMAAGLAGGAIAAFGSRAWLVATRVPLPSGSGEVSEYRMLSRLTGFATPRAVFDILGNVVGLFGYALMAGGIFTVVGLVAGWTGIRRLWRCRIPNRIDQVAAVAALALVLAIVLTATNFAGNPRRSDGGLYGRYLDPFLLPVVLLGVLGVLDWLHRPERRALVWRTTAVLVALASMAALVATLVLGSEGRVTQINALATYWFHPTGGRGVYLAIGAATVVFALVFAALATLDLRVGLAGLVLGMLALQTLFIVPDWRDAAAIRSRQHVLADVVRTRFPAEQCVTLIGSRSYGWHASNYEYYLGGIRVENEQSGRPDLCGNLYIARTGDARLGRLEGHLVTLENDEALELWVTADATQVHDGRDIWFPDAPDSALPDSAMSATITLVHSVSSVAVGDVLTLLIGHTGTGSPWANQKGLGSGKGFVQLGVRWSGPGGSKNDSIDLPRTMLPGDVVEMEVLLDAAGLAPGLYDVVIDLVQQGVARFDADRAAPIRLDSLVVG